jgi:cytochrome c-type biogenesis protein CcmH
LKTLRHLIAIGLLTGLSISLGHAVEIRNFANPEQQARYETLIQKLRCLVCQNQSLGDSDADLARDLRNEVYGRIQSGESEEETIRFLTDRYGDFVLYDPPVKGITLFLWAGPLMLFLVGGFLALRHLRSHRLNPSRPSLDPEEKNRLESLRNQLRQGKSD